MEATIDVKNVKTWTRHSAYQEFDNCWVPRLPTSWTAKRLKFIATASGERLNEKPTDVPYLGLEHVESKTGKLLLENEVETVESNMAVFREGDVLFGKLRPYLAKVASPSFHGVCSTELMVYRPSSELRTDYLKYQLLSNEFITFVDANAYGTKMPRVSENIMGNILLAVPPLPEQRAIAAFLDRETARIDALIGHKQRLIALLEEKRQAVISHAVTKGLDPNVKMKIGKNQYYDAIPEHWTSISVRNLVWQQAIELQDGNHGEIHPKAEDYVPDGIPFIMANCMNAGDIDLQGCKFISEDLARSLRIGFAKAGDVLLSHKGTIGEVAIIPDNLQFPFVVLTPQVTYYRINDVDKIDRDFLALFFQSRPFQSQLRHLAGGQATRDSLSLLNQRALTLVLPPINEQLEIASTASAISMRLREAKAQVLLSIDRLYEYRTALISAAVTGQIDVREEVQHDG